MKGAQLRATVVGGQTKSVEHYKTLFSVISSYWKVSIATIPKIKIECVIEVMFDS